MKSLPDPLSQRQAIV
ncbi:hypothetical protein 2AV2_48 [Nodularia phage vB_NpeS-2AV2]|uniref:Uncharacterized protein n=1 Tax=Nodularia phage vB_NpeS-2AV2 TaxID=1777122 RepID=A0A1L2BWT2_9CAUD|nr:hypothetical protein HWA92_gp048 [Nodularia phage vB_NpeS-2AV2]ALY07500.1 hypothetical protein 2AV2_48 [Nodularia phage vB_NpeS-2AV2]